MPLIEDHTILSDLGLQFGQAQARRDAVDRAALLRLGWKEGGAIPLSSRAFEHGLDLPPVDLVTNHVQKSRAHGHYFVRADCGENDQHGEGAVAKNHVRQPGVEFSWAGPSTSVRQAAAPEHIARTTSRTAVGTW